MEWIKKNIYYILGILTVLFFLFGQGVMWYAIGGDSEAYYIHFEHRLEVAPLYPLFLHIMDLIFGNELYLHAASVVQLIVTVICLMVFIRFIGKKLELDVFSIVVVWLGALIPFYLLLPEDPIPHVMLTESFTYPFMYVYAVLVLKAIFDNDEKYFFISALFVELMALIRGQMMFLFVVSMGMYFVWYIKRQFIEKNNKSMWFKKLVARMASLMLCILVCVMVGRGLKFAYERIFFNAPSQSFAEHLAVQKALYCSDEEDAALFEDEIEREIFEKTYAQMKLVETTYQYADSGLYNWRHAIEGFGANSRIVGDVIVEVLTEHGMWSEDEYEQEDLKLQYSGRLSRTLMKDNWKQYVHLFFVCLPSGFLSTVLFDKERIYLLLHIATAILYLLAITVSIFICLVKKKVLRETEYMWLVLITSIINVVASNAVHMGIQRYLAYTVGMFYVGAYLLVRRCLLLWNERKVVSKQ